MIIVVLNVNDGSLYGAYQDSGLLGGKVFEDGLFMDSANYIYVVMEEA